jgi:mono/diheme cytochrome c family protein
MTRGTSRSRRIKWWLALPAVVVGTGAVVAFTNGVPNMHRAEADGEQVLRGRQLVMESACGGCHGGADPSAEGWLTGYTGALPPEIQDYQVGPFHTYARNITPDNATGIGRFSERQIFNALRYGLRPGETPDVEITSSTPGEGNFPVNPKYLAPFMPWPAWRHLSDDDLWAIAAYLKRGVKPVRHRVEDSEGPPDFWAEWYAAEEYGGYPAPEFPTANETMPAAGTADLDQVLRGRAVVVRHDCGGCHGGFVNPAADGWLTGDANPEPELLLGACAGGDPEATPCFRSRPRNLTPDMATGIGRFSERQIFNALRYGLRPSETPDVEITSTTPGEGNFPVNPKYLAPFMPWQYWRHMSDDDLWAIAAYLKHGLKPVNNHVDDSDAPPDSWAGAYTVEAIGTLPPPSFPTANEIGW